MTATPDGPGARDASASARGVTGPPAEGDVEDNHGAPSWFWVDLPGLREVFLAAGFTEHVGTSSATRGRVVLMVRGDAGEHDPVIGEGEMVMVPIARYFGWQQAATTALDALERCTGTSAAHLGVRTEAEAQLWRVIAETRAVLAGMACGPGHVVDEHGNVSHRNGDDPGSVDLFANGRCEMRERISARLEHVLAGGR